MTADSLRFFFPKLKRRTFNEYKRIWPYLNMDHISLHGFEPFQSSWAFKKRIETILGTYSTSLFDGICDSERNNIIEAADQTLRHEFDLLGSGIIKSDPIDWQADLKSGKRWDKSFFLKIGHIPGADIKMPWELGRCQHLLWLGEAYLLTGREQYSQEIIDEVNWWIDDNPLMYSVNWKCAMDVAFRAVNWIFALNMISSYSGFNDDFTNKVSKSLWQHAFFIRNNLEKVIPYSNNHYTSDLVGLIYLGELFDESSKGQKWLKFALREFYAEIRKQVLPTGVHYERSVSYHRMMTEMLSYTLYMLQRIEERIPDDVIDLISNMYAYIANYTKPNGLAPLIGDNDDGRFVPLLKRDFRNHNYLNDINSVENRIITLGLKPIFCTSFKETHHYSDANVAIVHMDNHYLYINNGGYSKCPDNAQIHIGTHTHNDLLSFELSLNGYDIIVDSGTYLYTSSIADRNTFRATAKHNTAVVDNEEQNGMAEAFYLNRNVRINKLCLIAGGYEGSYNTIKGETYHYRQFHLTSNGLSISEHLRKRGLNHKAKIYYHFACGIRPVAKGDIVLLTDENTTISFSKKPDKMEIIDDTFSPSYGVLLPTKTLVVTYYFNNEITLECTIATNHIF